MEKRGAKVLSQGVDFETERLMSEFNVYGQMPEREDGEEPLSWWKKKK